MNKPIKFIAVLAIVGMVFTGCQKEQITIKEQQAPSIEEVFSKSNIVSTTENYTDTELGITGTLYMIKSANKRTSQKILKVEEEINNVDEMEAKGWIIKRGTVVTAPDHFSCTGKAGNCLNVLNKFIIAW